MAPGDQLVIVQGRGVIVLQNTQAIRPYCMDDRTIKIAGPPFHSRILCRIRLQKGGTVVLCTVCANCPVTPSNLQQWTFSLSV